MSYNLKNDNINDNDLINNFIYNFNSFCYIENENNIILKYSFLKSILTEDSYNIINEKVINTINSVLLDYDVFNVKLFIKTMSLIDVEKHIGFIYSISSILKEKFPNKLGKCFIYESPYLFTKIYSIISLFVDKKTLEKIVFFDN